MSKHEEEPTCYLESRLTKLEWQTQEHTDEIREVKKSTIQLTEALQEISVCLQQIKWTAFGAVTMLMMSQSGLGETIAMIVSK